MEGSLLVTIASKFTKQNLMIKVKILKSLLLINSSGFTVVELKMILKSTSNWILNLLLAEPYKGIIIFFFKKNVLHKSLLVGTTK